jgi:hypothetical protein
VLNSTAYPPGWQGHAVCLATSPATCATTNFYLNPGLSDLTMLGRTASSNVSTNIRNYNGKMGFLNANGRTTSIVLAINTTGAQNIQMHFDYMTIRNPYGSFVSGNLQNRINKARLQYRTNLTDDFINIPEVYYYNNTTQQTGNVTTPQNVKQFSFQLPSDCDNKSIVQLRWINVDSIGNGERPSFAVDNVLIYGDCQNIFMTEYVEGSGINKFIEIYNPNEAPYTFNEDSIVIFNNGNTNITNRFALVGTIPPKSTFVVSDPTTTLYSGTIHQKSSQLSFSGDDAIALKQTNHLTDIFGVIGEQPPGGGWANATTLKTLVRSKNVKIGNRTQAPGSFDLLNEEWEVRPLQDVSDLNSYIAHGCCVRFIDYISDYGTFNLTERCVDSNGWTYYGQDMQYHFAIKKKNNVFVPNNVSMTQLGAPLTFKDFNSPTNQHASFIHFLYWNVSYSGSLSQPVDIRMFFDITDTIFLHQTRDFEFNLLKQTFPQSVAVKSPAVEWFKTIDVPLDQSFFNAIQGNKYPLNFLKLVHEYKMIEDKTCVELKNIPSFSGGSGGLSFGPPNMNSINLLPLKWGRLQADLVNEKLNYHRISFETLSESNTSFFEIEFSQTLNNFKTIGDRIQALGTSYSSHTYETKVSNSFHRGYYRIKQYDIEGNFSYSPIFSIDVNQSSDLKPLNFYPNQFKTEEPKHIYIQGLAEEGIFTLALYDMFGRKIYQSELMPKEYIELPNLMAAATYILMIKQKNRLYHGKLIVR